jgi:hypothetical protein
MGSINAYYLNGPDLPSSTTVYTDALLTTPAPDGWYSANGITREQILGVLQEVVDCQSCARDCGTELSLSGYSSSANEQILFPNDVGFGLGCVEITILSFPSTNISGYRAIYNGISYNALIGQTTGFMQAPAGRPTYMLQNPCSILSNPIYFIQYSVDGVGSVNPTGNIVAESVYTSDIFPTSVIEIVKMFVPKTLISQDEVILERYQCGAFCTDASSSVLVGCPAPLPSEFVYTGETFTSSVDACGYDGDDYQSIYVGRVNGTPGVFGLYDRLFMDSSAYTPFPYAAGWYTHIIGASKTAIEVDSNGVIINTFTCP